MNYRQKSSQGEQRMRKIHYDKVGWMHLFFFIVGVVSLISAFLYLFAYPHTVGGFDYGKTAFQLIANGEYYNIGWHLAGPVIFQFLVLVFGKQNVFSLLWTYDQWKRWMDFENLQGTGSSFFTNIQRFLFAILILILLLMIVAIIGTVSKPVFSLNFVVFACTSFVTNCRFWWLRNNDEIHFWRS